MGNLQPPVRLIEGMPFLVPSSYYSDIALLRKLLYPCRRHSIHGAGERERTSVRPPIRVAERGIGNPCRYSVELQQVPGYLRRCRQAIFSRCECNTESNVVVMALNDVAHHPWRARRSGLVRQRYIVSRVMERFLA